MNQTITKTSACRPMLPTFYFVDIFNNPKARRQQILSSFTLEDLENEATAKSFTEALENVDKQLIK